ncbi:hypothetical protein Ccrd_007643 [Cynara cardunculus var. scolymus]|uniref:Lipase, GDSL n=1 Tax=Cynara cardunculus var. scolymus TaxID=59895 RepID=A0A103XGM1_CYNCS|nr:hypothetical protein Ccrd_007643 [Cynara cardunculus var. scolymus]
MELHRSIVFLVFLFLVAGETVYGNEKHQGLKKLNLHTYRAFRPTKLFVFGDSYSDTGNNPKSLASSWKNPYGVTFPGKPAGRYSDGRVITDYLARFMGIKSPLPYQWRKIGGNKLRSGINFAYGGTGVFDTGNFQPNMTTQIGYLQELINESVYTKRDLESSVALVTVSGNDYGAYTASGGSDQGLPAFITRVVSQMAINLKVIHNMGIRRVLVTSLQPLGCLPRATVLSSYQQCNATQNLSVDFHNQLLQRVVATLNNNTNDSRSLKFDAPLLPCCMGISVDANCGSVDENGKALYTVCKEPESTFFWDMVHPSQAGWRAVYLALRPTLTQIFY